MTETIKETALRALKSGFTPIPLKGKKPFQDGWQQFKNLTPATIEEWDKKGYWSDNIGVVCGENSSKVIVIDFDGLEGYKLFCQEFPELVETYTVATGSGQGMHTYYYVDLLPDSARIMDIVLEDTGEKINIEFRGDGLQVVIPPSIHPDTHQPYRVEKRLPVMKVTDLSLPIAWAWGMSPEGKQHSKTVNSTGKTNPKVIQALTDYFNRQPNKTRKGWINCSCPNASAHKHGDTEYSFGFNTVSGVGYCFRCKGMSPKVLCDTVGIRYTDLGGLLEKSESGGTSPNHSNGTAPAAYVGLKMITRADILTDFVKDTLNPDSATDTPPIVFPFKVLHKYGGMARVSRAGFMAALVGMSGTGKTSLLETIGDGYLMTMPKGEGILVWSPEWTAQEFQARAIQRYGGASIEDIWLYDIYKYERKNGRESGFSGKPLTAEQINATRAAYSMLNSWEGQVGYIEEKSLSVERLIDHLGHSIKKLNFKPRVLLIDYLQLMHASSNDKTTMYNLCMRIKAAAAENGLFTIAATQVTKKAGKDAKQFGEVLDVTDARFVNDDAFNLFITMTAEYENGEKQDTIILNVGKNSLGRTGKVRIPVNWERLWFADSESPNQNFGDAE